MDCVRVDVTREDFLIFANMILVTPRVGRSKDRKLETSMRAMFRRLMGPLLAGLCAASAAFAQDDPWNDRGALYTMSNSTDGNTVIVFRRGPDGHLSRAGEFPTDGLGTGGGLGNQGALALDQDGT